MGMKGMNMANWKEKMRSLGKKEKRRMNEKRGKLLMKSG
jgi:hypothetical protein